MISSANHYLLGSKRPLQRKLCKHWNFINEKVNEFHFNVSGLNQYQKPLKIIFSLYSNRNRFHLVIRYNTIYLSLIYRIGVKNQWIVSWRLWSDIVSGLLIYSKFSGIVLMKNFNILINFYGNIESRWFLIGSVASVKNPCCSTWMLQPVSNVLTFLNILPGIKVKLWMKK